MRHLNYFCLKSLNCPSYVLQSTHILARYMWKCENLSPIFMFFPFWTCYLVRWPYSVYFTHFVYWNGLYFESLKGNTLAHMTNLSHRRACRKKQGTYRLEMLAINDSPETLCTSSLRNKLLFDGRNTNFTFGVEW